MQAPQLPDALGHGISDKRIDILRAIARTGSISQAARDVSVSYKAAWQAVDTLTNLAGTPLVARAVGGSGGGGAQLTEAGHQLLAAADAMAQALADARLSAPLVPLYCNVDAAPVAEVDVICAGLVRQVTGMVRWRESVLAMQAAGVGAFVEFGGKVLGPMIGRTVADVRITSVVGMADIEALVKEL